METLDWFQVLVLALMQGITEFLPISSSAHLLLPSMLLQWQDQGLAFDVAVHFGTLLAVVWLFRREVVEMTCASGRLLTGGPVDDSARMLLFLVVATLPLVLVGAPMSSVIGIVRTPEIVAVTTVAFGLLLWFADSRFKPAEPATELCWRIVLVIGFAQVLALVPGTSRSGITITAALFMGLSRVAAARFSFMLAMPAIAASAVEQTLGLISSDETIEWAKLSVAAASAALVAFATMRLLLVWLERAGFLPFVIYRLLLGGLLAVLLIVQ